MTEKKPRLLLHSCCGPCSTAVIERLMTDFNITLFFYNPNITDSEEYERRKATQKNCLEKFREKTGEGISLLEGEYDPETFYKIVEGLEDQPEGGTRCNECFELRLDETAKKCRDGGYDYFATTLSVSPHKSYPVISALGNHIAQDNNIEFLDLDFKKKAGFQRSIALSKEFELYRQNYCGCQFSIRGEKNKNNKNKSEDIK